MKTPSRWVSHRKSSSSSSSSRKKSSDKSKNTSEEEKGNEPAKQYSVVVRLSPNHTASRFVDEQYYQVFERKDLKRLLTTGNVSFANWAARVRKNLKEHREAILLTSSLKDCRQLCLTLSQVGGVAHIVPQEQGALMRNIQQLKAGFPRRQLSGEGALVLISETVYVVRAMLRNANWTSTVWDSLSESVASDTLAASVSVLADGSNFVQKEEEEACRVLRPLASLIVLGASTDGIRPGGRVKLVEGNDTNALAKVGTVLEYDRGELMAVVAFDDDINECPEGSRVEVSKLVSQEALPPRGSDLKLDSNLVQSLVRFLSEDAVMSIGDADSELAAGRSTSKDEEEKEVEKKENEVHRSSSSGAIPRSTSMLSSVESVAIGGDASFADEDNMKLHCEALLSLMKSCVLGLFTSAFSSVEVVQLLDRECLETLLPVLRSISERCKPSMRMSSMRFDSRGILSHAIDTVGAAYHSRILSLSSSSLGTKKKTLENMRALPFLPPSMDGVDLPDAFDEYSAPHVFFSNQCRTVMFEPSVPTALEDGIPNVKGVMVKANRPIPVDQSVDHFYFEVTLNKVGTDDSSAVGIGIRSNSADYFLGADGNSWTAKREIFNRTLLQVGSYVDVKDTAQRPPKWEPSRVIETSDEKIRVGWLYWENPDYFQWVSRKSDHVAPYLTHTSGSLPQERDKKTSKYTSPAKSGTTIGCAVSLKDGKIFFTKNGVKLATAFDNVPLRSFTPAVELRTNRVAVSINFGQEQFRYNPFRSKGGFGSMSSPSSSSSSTPKKTVIRGGTVVNESVFDKRVLEMKQFLERQEKALRAEENRARELAEARHAQRVANAMEVMAMLPGVPQEKVMRALENHGDDLQATMNWVFNQPDPFSALGSLPDPSPMVLPEAPEASKEESKEEEKKEEVPIVQNTAFSPPYLSQEETARFLHLGRAHAFEDDVPMEDDDRETVVDEEVELWLQEVESGLRRARMDRTAVERIMTRLKQDSRDMVALLQAREVMPRLRDAPQPKEASGEEEQGFKLRPPSFDEIAPGVRVRIAADCRVEGSKFWLDDMDKIQGCTGTITQVNSSQVPPVVKVRVDNVEHSTVSEWWLDLESLRIVPPACRDAFVGRSDFRSALKEVVSMQDHISRVHARQALLHILGHACKHNAVAAASGPGAPSSSSSSINEGSALSRTALDSELLYEGLHAAAGEYLGCGVEAPGNGHMGYEGRGASEGLMANVDGSLQIALLLSRFDDIRALYRRLVKEGCESIRHNSRTCRILPDNIVSTPVHFRSPHSRAVVLSVFKTPQQWCGSDDGSDQSVPSEGKKPWSLYKGDTDMIITVYGNERCTRLLKRFTAKDCGPLVFPVEELWVTVTSAASESVDVLVSPIHWTVSLSRWMTENTPLMGRLRSSAFSLVKSLSLSKKNTIQSIAVDAALANLGASSDSSLMVDMVAANLEALQTVHMGLPHRVAVMRSVIVLLSSSKARHTISVQQNQVKIIHTLCLELFSLYEREKGEISQSTPCPSLLQNLWEVCVVVLPFVKSNGQEGSTPAFELPAWFSSSREAVKKLRDIRTSGLLLAPSSSSSEDEVKVEDGASSSSASFRDVVEGGKKIKTGSRNVGSAALKGGEAPDTEEDHEEADEDIEEEEEKEDEAGLSAEHWTSSHDIVLRAIVQDAASEHELTSTCAFDLTEVEEEVIVCLMEQRAKIEFKSSVVVERAHALLTFNREVSALFPLINLRQHVVDGTVASDLAAARHLLFDDVRERFLHRILDLSMSAKFSKHKNTDVMPRFPVHIDRLLAASAQRPGDTVFEQALRQFVLNEINQHPSTLRTPFTPPIGVKPLLSFEIHLKGEHVVGSDGPYRAFFSDVCRELQHQGGAQASAGVPTTDNASVSRPNSPLLPLAESKAGDEIPNAASVASVGTVSDDDLSAAASRIHVPELFVRCPNGVIGVGLNREKYVIKALSQSEEHLQMFRFLGQLMGVALRSSVFLSLDLPSLFWKSFVGETLTLKDLEEIDKTTVELITQLSDCESEEQFLDLFEDTPLTFTCTLSDSSVIDLIPNGENTPVTFENRLKFVQLLSWTRLHEADLQISAICAGFAEVVPPYVMTLFDAKSCEFLFCGDKTVDVEMLQRHTEYGGGLSKDSELIRNFWKVLEEFESPEREKFVEFVYAQKRLPSERDFERQRLRMLISPLDVKNEANVNQTFPHSDTCFFNLKLPRYTTKEALKKNLLLAISSDSGFGLDEEERQLSSMSGSRRRF